MKHNQIIIRMMMAVAITFGVNSVANAQFGNILNRVKSQAKYSIENAAVNEAYKAGRNGFKTTGKALKKSKKSKAETLKYEYGDHIYTMQGDMTADKYKKNGFGVVTFTNIPSDYDEFEAVYNEFLGKTPHGTAAMIPMAMEMFARNRQVGRRCIQLLNYSSNVNSMISRISEKFSEDGSFDYGQRYLPAALLQGATRENAYSPDYPYTVVMDASVNEHQQLQITGDGTVVYLYIFGGGWDTEQRQVEIMREYGSNLYKVFNCPSVYTGCKPIRGSWQGLK